MCSVSRFGKQIQLFSAFTVWQCFSSGDWLLIWQKCKSVILLEQRKRNVMAKKAFGREICSFFTVSAMCCWLLLCSKFCYLNTRLTRSCINRHRFVEATYAEEALIYRSLRRQSTRHIARTTLQKGCFATRIIRYPNSDSTFRIKRPLSCGDVSPNPGPVDALNSRSNQRENSRNICQLCERKVARNLRTLKCTQWSVVECLLEDITCQGKCRSASGSAPNACLPRYLSPKRMIWPRNRRITASRVYAVTLLLLTRTGMNLT